VGALYRTYRPLTFGDVIGQEAVVRTLRNALDTGQVRQAYLFAGPRGTGKTSMARILAKALNASGGPSVEFDPTTRVARAIADGTSLDVIEMDAASQRGIDDIREIRERALLQPAEGTHKVYIVDEAHQLTPAAWNALLKLIEEPPPHLVFVFCTTDRTAVLPTVRSRCQTFMFHPPRLKELVTALRRVCDGEEINAPDSALAQIARAAGGSFRDAISILDQLASATGKDVTVGEVMQLVGTVDDEALVRLCDTVIDRDTAGALTLVEELAEQGQDLARLVTDLVEHLRHLLLVQHLGQVPDSLPVTEEHAGRIQEQANQLPEPAVLRLIDLLAVAIEDQRQGGDPRLPLELALVKVTRPAADLSRESLAHRVELLETRLHAPAVPSTTPAAAAAAPAPRIVPSPSEPPEQAEPADDGGAPIHDVTFEQLRDAWSRSVLPAVEERSIPTATLLQEAVPTALVDGTLTLAFPGSAEFHRVQLDDPRATQLVRDALFEVTGQQLTIVTERAEATDQVEDDDEPLGEERLIALLEDRFNAREVEDTP
jgi:DNA polymerase-3 subunit gamma/tau